jgi:hypothetical protein
MPGQALPPSQPGPPNTIQLQPSQQQPIMVSMGTPGAVGPVGWATQGGPPPLAGPSSQPPASHHQPHVLNENRPSQIIVPVGRPTVPVTTSPPRPQMVTLLPKSSPGGPSAASPPPPAPAQPGGGLKRKNTLTESEDTRGAEPPAKRATRRKSTRGG